MLPIFSLQTQKMVILSIFDVGGGMSLHSGDDLPEFNEDDFVTKVKVSHEEVHDDRIKAIARRVPSLYQI